MRVKILAYNFFSILKLENVQYKKGERILSNIFTHYDWLRPKDSDIIYLKMASLEAKVSLDGTPR